MHVCQGFKVVANKLNNCIDQHFINNWSKLTQTGLNLIDGCLDEDVLQMGFESLAVADVVNDEDEEVVRGGGAVAVARYRHEDEDSDGMPVLVDYDSDWDPTLYRLRCIRH